MSKVLIYGANGWIGGMLRVYLGDTQVFSGEARIDSLSDVERELEEIQPTHVMCLVGRTHGKVDPNTSSDTKVTTIDYLEQPGKLRENIRDNLYGPLLLANACKRRRIHMTYMGTGCIFSYDDQTHQCPQKEYDHQDATGFSETSKPNFFGSAYSTTKGFTDRMMQEMYDDSVLNVRIRMPITSDRSLRNFITKITTYEYICSIPNSMSVLDNLLPLMIEMALSNQCGTINLVNPGYISHNEILKLYREIVDPQFTWKTFSAEDQATVLSAERSNNVLCTSKLQQLFPARLLSIRDAVIRALETMAALD